MCPLSRWTHEETVEGDWRLILSSSYHDCWLFSNAPWRSHPSKVERPGANRGTRRETRIVNVVVVHSLKALALGSWQE